MSGISFVVPSSQALGLIFSGSTRVVTQFFNGETVILIWRIFQSCPRGGGCVEKRLDVYRLFSLPSCAATWQVPALSEIRVKNLPDGFF